MALVDMLSPVTGPVKLQKQPKLKPSPPVASTLENPPGKMASMATGAVGPGSIRWINRGAKPAAGPSLGTGGVALDGGS